MKINNHMIQGLALLPLFAFNSQLPIAHAGDAALLGKANQTQTIPWNQIGAKAGANYQGDGLAVTPTADGARLRCIFQSLDGEATTGGLWLTSTVTNQTGDRFQVKAASLGRNGAISPLADKGTVSVASQTVRFERAGLVEEYAVSLDGVSQDFVVPEKPAGIGELELRLAVTGARVEATTDGAQLMLVHSGRKIAYHRLRVTDAAGKELPARIGVASHSAFHIPHSALDLAVVVNDAGAVYPVRIDPTFSDANWVSMGGIDGTDGQVQAIAMDGSGNLYIGGQFTVAGKILANNIAKWNGSTWSALGSGVSGLGYNGYGDYSTFVDALAVSGNTLYAGGCFTNAGGVAANYIAQWDGSSWSALGSGMDSRVVALEMSGSTLYAGGFIATAGGVPVNCIARWNGNTWSALGSGVNGAVFALAVSRTNLYAGGSFRSAGVVTATNVAQWNGSSWSALGLGISGVGGDGYGPYVDALAVSGNTLYVGGDFGTAGGIPVNNPNNIAQWNGSNWSLLGSGIYGIVSALAVSGTNLYAAGSYTMSGDESQILDYIARWNGSSWSALGSGMSGSVGALAVCGTNLYVGGSFSTAGGVAANDIAQWNGSGWSNLGLGTGSDDGNGTSVFALALSGNTLYMGGDFTTAGGVSANHIAQWNGCSWSALGLGMDETVRALAVSGTNLYAGGSFSMAGGVSANHIAQWNGTSWSAMGSGMDSDVSALTVSGKTLYAGGDFTISRDGNQTFNYIAQWDGSSWSALGSGMNNDVYALAVSGDTLYAGGDFTSSGDGSQTLNYIAQWNGSSWSPLGSGFDNDVNALAVSSNMLYAGGYFTASGDGSQGFGYIAQWDGSSWSLPGFVNDVVWALAMSGDTLYAGGNFTNAGGVAANYIAQWDGNNWSALGSGMNNFVSALAVSVSLLNAGGGFTTAGGKVSAYAAEAIFVLPPAFQGTPVRNTGGSITLHLSTATNTPSRLYSVTNLFTPVVWQPISTNFNGGLWQFTDTNAAAFKSKFYRLSTP